MMAEKLPKFKPEPDQVAVTIQEPDLKLCTICDGVLTIPRVSCTQTFLLHFGLRTPVLSGSRILSVDLSGALP